MSIDEYGEPMDADEVAAFLESQGVGTLAFGNASGAYAIPMSFGYDRVQKRCIFQFAFAEGSMKASYLNEENTVMLSVYEWSSIDDWRSVVLRGHLKRIPEAHSAKAAGIFAAHAKIASLEVFRRPLEELDLEWYELGVEEMDGRASS